MRKDLSLKIYAHDQRKKGDRAQLFVRIIYDRKKAEIATSFFVEEKDWDSGRERFKRNDSFNADIASIEKQIRDIKQQLQFEGKIVTAKRIKEIYTGRDTIDTFLLVKYKSFINNLNPTNIAAGTISTYAKTLHTMERFLKVRGERDINVRNIDLTFIEEWDGFLSKQKGMNGEPMKVNTIAKHHSRFRTFCIYLENHQLIERNPYRKFRLKYVESERTFLTREELERLSNCNLGGNQSLERVRDIFLFSVYTGLRFGDAQKLRMSELILKGGRWYFQHRVQKSHKGTQFPVLPPAVRILNKYEDTAERDLGRVLPKISNQKLNAFLKVIAEIAGIKNKHISHHVARHTCATTILLENSVRLEVVQAWLNHSSLKETMIYAKLTNRVVNESVDVEALFNKW